MAVAPELSVKKISRSLSVDMELYCRGRRRSNRSSVPPLSKHSVANPGGRVDSREQQFPPARQDCDQDALRHHPETTLGNNQQCQREAPEPLDGTTDIQFSGRPEAEFPTTGEPPLALSVFADTATRLGGIIDEVLSSNGPWTPSGEF
jgi:hypothetical protein